MILGLGKACTEVESKFRKLGIKEKKGSQRTNSRWDTSAVEQKRIKNENLATNYARQIKRLFIQGESWKTASQEKAREFISQNRSVRA